ncbi:MAG: type IX secretion system sortase PorU [Chlorobi bacterium]|nr:type IX secretion system sortase PorU [Chlorobiota bacterium]
MKYSRFGFITVVLFITSFVSFGQSFSRKIIWESVITKYDSSHVYRILNFKNAVISNNLLPYYSENINIKSFFNSNYDYSIKLENKKFIALTEDETEVVSASDNLPSLIESDCSVLFAGGIPYLQIKFLPLIKNKAGKILKLQSFDIKILKKIKYSKKNKSVKNTANSVLRSGTWKKIRIEKSGIYKITFEQLRAMGFNNPENIRIFGNAFGWLPMIAGENRPDDLTENDILIKDNAVYFFGQGPDRWDYDETDNLFIPVHHFYSQYAYYFLTDDYESGYDNRIKNELSSTLPETRTVTEYDALGVHETDNLHIEDTGRRMFGESFDVEVSRSFDFSFPDLAEGSESFLYMRAASNSSSSYFKISVNGHEEVMNFGYIGDHDFADAATISFNFSAPSGNVLTVNTDYYRTSPAAQAWLDYIYINTRCKLKFAGGQLLFRNSETYGAGEISKYYLYGATNGVTVWDITDKTKPRKVETLIEGNNLTFKLSGDVLREFAAFDNTSFLTVDTESAEDVPNQNLHATSGKTDMIIVTNPDFLLQANKLKNIHEEKDEMNVKVVTTQQVFNEFSCGMPDFSAIRDYVKMVYERAADGDTLKYLCLFGDGSYDNRSGEGINGNYVITYQQSNSVSLGSSKVSDDFFGYLDDGEGDFGTDLTGMLDIGIGRIPVSSSEQAENYIAKINEYLNPSSFGDWRNMLSFIADDENNNIHMIQADSYAEYIKSEYPFFNIEKIYLDAYTQYTVSGGERYPDVNTAINNRVQKGALLINYTGHGGEQGLAHERVVTISDIDSWNNFDKLPLFVTATCEFTRFDDYKFLSAGEHVFLNPKGGAIAMFTTARIAWIYSNGVLSTEFYKNVFENFDNGDRYRLGDIIRITKIHSNSNNNLIFFLMGDPALKLGYAADNKIITTKINGHPVSETDTLKALSKASFSGIVADKDGNKLTNFNGFVYPSVFDKEVFVNTLNNDDNGVFTYKSRNNIVYRGKASVKNGDFAFEFIVPRDIILSVDTGKISYYADNGFTDAKGYGFDFQVGDIAENYEEDNTGPEIDLYMNDENFVSGGITDANPRIFAKLYDEHGINTATGGIGHDITGILDNDIRNIIIMNGDYRADEDTYKSGTVEHFLFDLEEGEHNLKFKAWDVYNNSSEAELDFTVALAQNLSVDMLLNYPNPFTTHTDFWFEHNQAGQNLDVIIQIFTVSGKLVKTIEANFTADGYRAGPFAWDGTDDFGNRIGRGVYVYRVKLRNEAGEVAEKFEKLLILK